MTQLIKINFLGKAIRSLSGDCSYDSDGKTILKWKSPDITEPSQADIDAKIVELKAEYDANQYQRDRQYPALGEQLDMLFHDMTAGKGTKSGEWYKAVAKVKADNPKPE